MNLKKIQKSLKKELDSERYEHTIGVMYTAAALAMAHNFSIKDAQLAGLLHDCAKCIPNDEKIRLCVKNGIQISQSELKSPYLIHAKLGAFFAREIYQIENEEILQAIRLHTTGAPHMSKLDKIIYIADYIEPHRDRAPNLNQIRKIAFQDLDETMLRILSDTLDYLSKHKGTIDSKTEEAYRYFTKLSKD